LAQLRSVLEKDARHTPLGAVGIDKNSPLQCNVFETVARHGALLVQLTHEQIGKRPLRLLLLDQLGLRLLSF
jgi:hypothetical protein